MKITDTPVWIVGFIVVMGALGFLTWHSYARDDDDEAWLDPGQPPAQVMLPLTPAAHGSGSPMSCGDAFRGRCYPDVLATAQAVLKGVGF